MLPKAVEEQVRRAEDLHRQMYGNTEGNPAPTEEAEVAPEEPKAAVETPAEEVVTPEQESNYKRQLEVLKGKYSAEVPRMAQEIRDLKEELAKFQMNETPQPRPSKLKPEEIEEYGEGFIDVMKRAAAEVVPEDVGQIKKQVDELRAQTNKLSQERFFNDLSRQAPQWERLNEDKEFLTWLSGIDPFTGRIRQEVFDEATSSRDSWRVANFFNAFGGEPKPEQPVTDPLVEQVEPHTTRVSAPPPGRRIYSTSDIAQFYSAVREGRYSRDEAARIEQDIFAAQSEGRIRQRR